MILMAFGCSKGAEIHAGEARCSHHEDYISSFILTLGIGYIYIYFTVNQFFLATVHHSSILFYSNHHSSIDRNHQNHHLTMIGKSIFLFIVIMTFTYTDIQETYILPLGVTNSWPNLHRTALESNMAMGNSPLIPWNFPFKAPFFWDIFQLATFEHRRVKL